MPASESQWLGLVANCCACYAADVATANAKVVQFAVGHASEFCNGLSVLAPVVERTSDVHDRDPFGVSVAVLASVFAAPVF